MTTSFVLDWEVNQDDTHNGIWSASKANKVFAYRKNLITFYAYSPSFPFVRGCLRVKKLKGKAKEQKELKKFIKNFIF